MQKFIESLFKASDWWHKRAKGWVKFVIIAAAFALLLAIWSLLVEAFIYALTSQKHRTRCSAQISKIHLDKAELLRYNQHIGVAVLFGGPSVTVPSIGTP
mgnify:CR=1 FL=1